MSAELTTTNTDEPPYVYAHHFVRVPSKIQKDKNMAYLVVGPVTDDVLWKYNLAVCLVHFAAAVYTMVEIALDNDWEVLITTSYMDWRLKNDTLNAGCRDNGCVVTNEFASFSGSKISLLGLVLAFHFLSFSWQLLTLFDTPISVFYKQERIKNRNALRWIEYSLSTPPMMVVIASALGVIDVAIFALLAICTSALMAFGYLSEIFLLHVPKSETIGVLPLRYAPNIIGWVFFISFWAVLTFTFTTALERSQQKPPQDVLAYMYAIYTVMLPLFGCFGIVQSLHAYSEIGGDGPSTKRRPRLTLGQYNTVEVYYCIFSLTSKLLLGVLLTFMVRTRSNTVSFQD